MGVFSTMSLIHKMSSILAQFQLKKQVKRKIKNNKIDEMKTLTLAYILVLQTTSSSFSFIF